ncbi:hypothetical protein Metho_1267 [Methanomethylovorans hollandica DSM 15978]|uniref:Uncharacterized protein n=1 Tax=Methanomethylovorans hollandica (strain DSM 15978 / NBRC 107637 / DMS1) TaxID=867904 RepID=L0KZS5_METHD|nr:SIR2 family protein [Methanomethylovorans hollandica]AGB49494.1 hypothetical protein Metho_1267 [Methanomethylovorans hollandica DSM 15978]
MWRSIFNKCESFINETKKRREDIIINYTQQGWNNFFSEILDDSNEKKYLFLVGAGISIDSGLPNFTDFLRNFLGHLLPNECNPNLAETTNLIIDKLRPEVILQEIYQLYGNRTLKFYSCLEGGEPNYNHYFLALALKRGHCVFTTNIDTLIEKACERLEIDYELIYLNDNKQKKEYKKYLENDILIKTYEQIAKEEPFNIGSKIFKLHGTIQPGNSIHKYKSIRFMLNRVGLGLDESMRKVFENALKERDVVVLGYSGNDHFSVDPVLRQVESDQNICWFKYKDSIDLVESSRDFKSMRGDFFKEVSIELFDIWRDISPLDVMISWEPNSYLIKGDSSRKIKEAILQLKTKNPEFEHYVNQLQIKNEVICGTNQQSSLVEWTKKINDFQRNECASILFQRIGDVEKAEYYLQQAEKLSSSDIDKRKINNLKTRLFLITRRPDEFNLMKKELKISFDSNQCSNTTFAETIHRFNESIDQKDDENDFFSAFDLSLEIINLLRANREFDTALEEITYLKQKLESRLKHKSSKKKIYEYSILRAKLLRIHGLICGLGLKSTVKNKVEGIVYCAEAYEISHKIGDITAKAQALNARGLIVYQLIERSDNILEDAENSVNESFILHTKTTDKRKSFQSARNILLINRLRYLNAKTNARNYWIKELEKSLKMVRDNLDFIETGEVPTGDEIEYLYRDAEFSALKGDNQESITKYTALLTILECQKNVLHAKIDEDKVNQKDFEQQMNKNMHMMARVTRDLLNLSTNSCTDYINSLILLVEYLLNSNDICSYYKYDSLPLQNINDMLNDVYCKIQKSDVDNLSKIEKLMDKGAEISKSIDDYNLLIKFTYYR